MAKVSSIKDILEEQKSKTLNREAVENSFTNFIEPRLTVRIYSLKLNYKISPVTDQTLLNSVTPSIVPALFLLLLFFAIATRLHLRYLNQKLTQ